MEKLKKLSLLCLTFLLIVRCSTVPNYNNDSVPDFTNTKKFYYGVEVNGQLCGYSELTEKYVKANDKDVIHEDMQIFMMLSLLGSDFNVNLNFHSVLDPQTRKFSYYLADIDHGTTSRKIEVKIDKDIAIINTSHQKEDVKIKVDSDVLLGMNHVFNVLKTDFLVGNEIEKTYRILEPAESAIQKSTFMVLDEDTILIKDKLLPAIVFLQRNNTTGLKTKYWLDENCDQLLAFEVLNRRVFLADRAVADRIKVAKMDDAIFTPTNESISDIHTITYMKLQAEIEPSGVSLSNKDLNVPGQKFTGTINDNLIKGIFEISRLKYNGEEAPPFPTNYDNNKELMEYLSPGYSIESDDSILIKKAMEITKEAKNSWEAATLLSDWVAKNIAYTIPGGITARKTYDMKAGECGAHSCLLAAFCRAVGIPARVVWGGMYVPNNGGGFGQHGWNEIYMGDAGWIPVDATAFETDFADAGHIRIAELKSVATSFNAKNIEILDYRTNNDNSNKENGLSSKYNKYLGDYVNKKSGKTFKVLSKEGGLSLDIPGQMVLPFLNEDAEGNWFCKLSNKLYMVFEKDDNENIVQMILHEIVYLPRQLDEQKNKNIPEKFKKYLGNYLFPQRNAEFTVTYKDNSLAVIDPFENKTIKLRKINNSERWIDEYEKNQVYFSSDEQGNVTAMNLDVANNFEKK